MELTAIATGAHLVGLAAVWNFYISHIFIMILLGCSVMTTVLIVIGELQGCTFIGDGIVWLGVVNKICGKKTPIKQCRLPTKTPNQYTYQYQQVPVIPLYNLST